VARDGEPGGTTATADTFDSLDPATGDVVGTHPVLDADAVTAVVARARTAADTWQTLGFTGRQARLDRWRAEIGSRASELADLVLVETGKPHRDGMLEIGFALDHLAWAARRAPRVLGRRSVAPGALLPHFAATVEYLPYGVVGVIGPWNFPVYTPMGSIAYALSAGNTVVFKPSEHSSGVGRWLVDAFAAAVPDCPDALCVVTGLGDTGGALCAVGVDKVAFTGSPGTARKVLSACADALVPAVIEGGGKDALVVADDADVAAAADAAVWGGMFNAGQMCTGIERVYVHEQVYDHFVAELTRRARELRPGTDAGSSYGPMTLPGQLDVVRRHISDALNRGGRAVVGGADAVGERTVAPTVLLDVPEDSDAVREETFGPTLTVTKVADVDEAVDLVNASAYGLGSAVFSRQHGDRIAGRLRVGMCSVNSVIGFAAMPSVPFGGRGASGFGRVHGPDGLREFAYPRSVARQRFALPVAVQSFRRTERTDRLLARVIRLRHGRRR